MWKRFERKIRLCRLFFCWVFCVERSSFWLRALWFDCDSFFACCVWICYVFRDFFDFRRFFEWKLIVVCVVLFVEKRRIESKKKIVFTSCFFVCFFVNSFIESLLAFVLSVLESSFLISFEWSFAFLNSKKYEIVREKKNKVSWWKNCHKKRCFELL